MSCSATPVRPSDVLIALGVVPAVVAIDDDDHRILFGDPGAARPAGILGTIDRVREALKEAFAEVHARQDLRGGRAGSLRAARRLACRKAGIGPDPKRFDRPPSAEVRKARKALRRRLARST